MAMNVGGGEEAEAMSDINVTPLVDVMLVLLIIFIITIRVIIQQVPVRAAEGDQSADADQAGEHHHRRRQAGRHLLEHQAAVGSG